MFDITVEADYAVQEVSDLYLDGHATGLGVYVRGVEGQPRPLASCAVRSLETALRVTTEYTVGPRVSVEGVPLAVPSLTDGAHRPTVRCPLECGGPAPADRHPPPNTATVNGTQTDKKNGFPKHMDPENPGCSANHRYLYLAKLVIF